MFCQKCGAQFAPGASFCGSCGAKMVISQQAPSSEQMAAPPLQFSQSPPSAANSNELKTKLVSALKEKFISLGVPLQNASQADISVATEFLDAKWSTGSKKISYEASVFADVKEHTVYMYEKTTETGHGLSFGGGMDSSFQSGTTLFRKVKSIQYGPDGKAYELSLDLGSISKAAKETAQNFGWKFKTVLNKNKAMYP